MIAELYSMISEVQPGVKRLLQRWDIEGEQATAEEIVHRIDDYVRKKRIYLPANTCEALKHFSNTLHAAVSSVSLNSMRANKPSKEHEERLKYAVDALVPALRSLTQNLENEFRALLGDRSPNQ